MTERYSHYCQLYVYCDAWESTGGAVNLTIDNVLFWTSKLLRDVRVGKT